MVDYSKVTKQGYVVKKLYLTGIDAPIPLAILKREDDYLWAYGYHLDKGTWGQGHYDFDTMSEAINDLKAEYPRARPVNAKDIYSVETKVGSFGFFDSLEQARKRAYHIAKDRQIVVYICDYRGDCVFEVKWDSVLNTCYISELKTRIFWRLYADGHIVHL